MGLVRRRRSFKCLQHNHNQDFPVKLCARRLVLMVKHHKRAEEHVLLIFPVVLQCKGEVVQLLPMFQNHGLLLLILRWGWC